MHVAVGTSLLVIVLNTMAGFLGYLNHVQVDFKLIGAVSVIAIAGSFVGSALATKINPASLRRAFAVFVLAMAAFILVREVDVWIKTAQEALLGTTPQIVFAVLMLAVGIAAGRVTRRAAREPLADRLFSDGGGI
jgi:uncharacterized membrane protein YfcA